MAYRQTARSAKVRARSRSRILRSARRLFARQGVESTTMDQIARAADSSVGNLYFYFKNKEALVEAVVMAELAAHGRRVDRRLVDVPPGPVATAIGMYSYLESLFREPEITRIVVVGEGHPVIRKSLVDNLIARIQDRLPQEIRSRRGGEAEMAAVAEVGAVFSLVEAQLAGRLSASPDHFFRFTTGLRLRIYQLTPEEENEVIARTETIIGWREGRGWDELTR